MPAHRVFITGASGWLGSRVAKLLVARGDTVYGLARSEASAAKVKALGATPVLGSFTDTALMKKHASEVDAVVACAYNHEDMASDHDKVAKEDQDSLKALIEGLKSNKNGHKALVYMSGTLSNTSPGEDSEQHHHGMARWKSDEIVKGAADNNLHTVVVRLAPVTHCNEVTHPFLVGWAVNAKKLGYVPYIEPDNVWPSTHYDDAADLIVRTIDTPIPGNTVHAIAEEGVAHKDIAAAIGKELGGLEPKQITKEEAGPLGFIGFLLGASNHSTAHKTKEWTKWNPTRPTMLEDLKTHGLPEAN